MTVENCIKNLELFKYRLENYQTLGKDTVERESIRRQSQKAFDNMTAHINSQPKRFIPKPKNVNITKLKTEVNKFDGTKSKR